MAEGQEITVREDAEDKLHYLDEEDMKRYEAITSVLIGLNLNTPGDDTLNQVVSNLINKSSVAHANLISALARKEYKFANSLSELVLDYAFNGLEIPGSEQARVASMLVEAIEMEEEKEKAVGGR